MDANKNEDTEEEVLVEEHNSVRILTLNRPRVLNSLNLSVVSRLAELFEEWETDEHVSLIIIKAAGGVFSAGGDLKMFYNAGKANESWKEVVYKKYWLDYHLYTYKKSRIVIWNGLVVGGGAGFTYPSAFRIVTEKAFFSTPEVAVGFHTDCSASYYLPRLPDRLGEYLALTGTKLDHADMLASGIATHFVPSQDLAKLEKRLLSSSQSRSVQEIVEEFSRTVTVGEKSVMNKLNTINRCFSKDRVEDIISALAEEDGSDKWCEQTFKLLNRFSPIALKQTLASIRRGRHERLEECLQREFRLTLNCLRGLISDDLYEGIRAAIIDKDNKPKWKPASLAEVTDEMVDRVLSSSKDQEQLHLPVEAAQRWTGKFSKF